MNCQTSAHTFSQKFLTTALIAGVIFMPHVTLAATDSNYFADDVNQTQDSDEGGAFTEFITWVTGGDTTEAATEDESDPDKLTDPKIILIDNRCVYEQGTVETKIDDAESYELTSTNQSRLVAAGSVIGFHTFAGLNDGSYTLTAYGESGFFESYVFSVSCDPEEDEDEGPTPDAEPLEISCSVTPKNAEIDQRVDWSSSVSGGVGSYRFEWRGDAYSNSSTAVSRFSVDGNKAATVYVFDSENTRKEARCRMTVEKAGEVKGEKDEPYLREIEEF